MPQTRKLASQASTEGREAKVESSVEISESFMLIQVKQKGALTRSFKGAIMSDRWSWSVLGVNPLHNMIFTTKQAWKTFSQWLQNWLQSGDSSSSYRLVAAKLIKPLYSQKKVPTSSFKIEIWISNHANFGLQAFTHACCHSFVRVWGRLTGGKCGMMFWGSRRRRRGRGSGWRRWRGQQIGHIIWKPTSIDC